MKKEILIKIHKSYRWVVAICDKDIYGQKLEEGIRELDLTTQFFQGEETDEQELTKMVKMCLYEDATFYVVGNKSIEYAKKIKLIENEGVTYIQGIPFALVLL